MNRNILVIDDEEGVRDAFELALIDSGHTVLTAETGERGLEIAAGTRPDLVFLDLRMPGMGGVKTLRALQSGFPDVPIQIMTAFYQEFMDELSDAMRDGAEFELARKPLDADQIRMIVQSVLDESPFTA
ncbi:MAG: response regulator [Gammaproteobacteria bacterium]